MSAPRVQREKDPVPPPRYNAASVPVVGNDPHRPYNSQQRYKMGDEPVEVYQPMELENTRNTVVQEVGVVSQQVTIQRNTSNPGPSAESSLVVDYTAIGTICTFICCCCCAFIPGLICLIPATVLSTLAMQMKNKGRMSTSKTLSYAAINLLTLFYFSFVFLTVIFGLAGAYASLTTSYAILRQTYYSSSAVCTRCGCCR